MAQSTRSDVVYCYVIQGTYENRKVFRFEDCKPFIDKEIFTLDCDGNRIGSNQETALRQDIKNLTVIWKPRDFTGQLNF